VTPTISIVVPNLNGGATLSRTLNSLIAQDYAGLEIIVVDGGSSDESVEIIRQYEQHIVWWTSEKDQGQAHAINKGFARCGGEVVNWLCSDDALCPGALHRVSRVFGEQPQIDVVAGACQVIDEVSGQSSIARVSQRSIAMMPAGSNVSQQSCFYRRRLLARTPPLDESLHYAMDTELWNFFKASGARWAFIDDVLAAFHLNGANKTQVGGQRIIDELEMIYQRYSCARIPLTFWYRMVRMPLQRRWCLAEHKSERLFWRAADLGVVALLAPFYGWTATVAFDRRPYLKEVLRSK
jgi:glycosyltransferase involved in cell wall biosynthesis